MVESGAADQAFLSGGAIAVIAPPEPFAMQVIRTSDSVHVPFLVDMYTHLMSGVAVASCCTTSQQGDTSMLPVSVEGIAVEGAATHSHSHNLRCEKDTTTPAVSGAAYAVHMQTDRIDVTLT